MLIYCRSSPVCPAETRVTVEDKDEGNWRRYHSVGLYASVGGEYEDRAGYPALPERERERETLLILATG